jgi:hypothetical protein
MTEEMINLYGIHTKFLVVEKINVDSNVFGDYSHLKTDNSQIFDIFMLPENSEDWDSEGYAVSQFGLINFENVTLFAAKSSFDGIVELKSIVGNLLVFPNNKIMEITDVDATVPGINNLFSENDAKSVYKLTCKPYDVKLVHEIDPVDISVAEDPVAEPYMTLDNYFDELINQAAAQDEEAEVIPQVDTVDKSQPLDQIVEKPIIDNTEQSPFGDFD